MTYGKLDVATRLKPFDTCSHKKEREDRSLPSPTGVS